MFLGEPSQTIRLYRACSFDRDGTRSPTSFYASEANYTQSYLRHDW